MGGGFALVSTLANVVYKISIWNDFKYILKEFI